MSLFDEFQCESFPREECKYFLAEEEEENFMSDGDEEPEALSWRGDPEANLSDWTITINTEDGDSSQTYHVHKAILAASSKPCKYFSTLFQTKVNLPENKDSTSRITLGMQEAEAFPIMLDYVYSSDASIQGITTQNAVAIRSLARYFRCRELTKSVNQFVQRDLSTGTAALYLEKAFECNDGKIEESARKLIVENFTRVCETKAFMMGLPVALFRSIICSPDLHAYYHPIAGDCVKDYFEANPELLSASLLNDLTKHLSSFFQTSAEGLLQLIEQLDPSTEDQESWLALDRLAKLCADTLGPKWMELDTEKYMHAFNRPTTEGLTIARLSAALNAAKGDYKTKLQEIDRLKKKNSEKRNEIKALKARNAELTPTKTVRFDAPPRKRKRSSTSSLYDIGWD